MELQKVELRGLPPDLLQHAHVQRVGIAHRVVVAQRTRPHRPQRGRCRRIAACKQRHLVAERDQLLGQPVDDPLGAAVLFRGDSFDQRRDLGDAHPIPL